MTITWTTHRHPESVYGPHGISYYSAQMTPTEYLTVRRDGDWRWDIYTTRRHNTFGRTLSVRHGTAPTRKEAKAAAEQAHALLPAT